MPGPGWLWWNVTCRPSAASTASRAAVSGMKRAIASEQSRSIVGRPTLWEYAASWRSTWAAASMVRFFVREAILRAFHAGRSPLVMRAQWREAGA